MRDRLTESDVADGLFRAAESNIFDRLMKDGADMIVFNGLPSSTGQQVGVLIFRAQNLAGGPVVFDFSQHGYGQWNQAVFSKFGWI